MLVTPILFPAATDAADLFQAGLTEISSPMLRSDACSAQPRRTGGKLALDGASSQSLSRWGAQSGIRRWQNRGSVEKAAVNLRVRIFTPTDLV